MIMAGKLISGRPLTKDDQLSGHEIRVRAKSLLKGIQDQATREALGFIIEHLEPSLAAKR